MSTRPVVLLSTMYSPFQIAVARAMRARGVDYRVIFTVEKQRGENQRGKHWTADRPSEDFIDEVYGWSGPAELTERLAPLLTELDPSVLIGSGIQRSPIYAAIRKLKPQLTARVGFWLELPDLSRGFLTTLAIRAVGGLQLRQTADFVLAIGDRAQRFYQGSAPDVPVHLVPYGQDLSHHLAIERGEPHAPITFLFSGQLLPRNNIRQLVAAFDTLATTHPGQWRFIVAAGGPEEPAIRELMARSPAANGAIVFDREYETWLDRIRPFRDADVLICPSLHAGWALVVPEAMAAGMPVIATRFVNAARFYVRPDVSGLFVTPDAASIYRALRRFVEDPAAIGRMGAEARVASHDGTAEAIAARLCAALRI